MKTSSIDSANLINVVISDNVSKQSSIKSNEFSDIISNITESSSKDLGDVSKNETSKSVSEKKELNSSVTEKLNNSNVTETDDNVDETQNDQVESVQEENTAEQKLSTKDKLDETSEKIKNTLLDALGISEEELESAMQILGLNYLDCLDKTNLAQLLTKVTGNNDVSVLITNENLYQQFNDIVTVMDGMKENILTDLGISEEELATTIEQYNTSLESSINDTIQFQTQNLLTDESGVQVMPVVENVRSNQIETPKSTLEQENNSESVLNTVQEENGNSKIVTQTQNESNQQMEDQADNLTQTDNDTAKVEDHTMDNFHKLIPNQENVVDNLDEQIVLNEATTVDTESLIEQIQNQIKISSTLDSTTMEFDLNPEHLGKLTIQLVSKDGMITAHITTQNTTVKELIESQIMQLKENMNNQGLKVEAVEVTIESHEFEKNLEQGNSSSGQEHSKQQQQKTRRQININDPDSLENLTSQEALIAEMMIGNGNSLNFTA